MSKTAASAMWRYRFSALHPQLELPQPVRVSSCVSCHLGAEDQNFGSWETQTQVIP